MTAPKRVRKTIAVIRPVQQNRFYFATEFVCAARGYWLSVFPRVAVELRRRRALATRIPDPVLRRLALQALERKGHNLEGAAAFAILAPRPQRPLVVQALVCSQAMCDYLDVLCEQPNRDPVANGYALHDALLDAVATPGFRDPDYYRHHPHRKDGGYLRALIDGVSSALVLLPARDAVAAPIARAAKRIASYQALNHCDVRDSYQPFEHWARSEGRSFPDMRWWEAGAGAGSTLSLHVLLGVAADPRVHPRDVSAIDDAYFPWIGALHSMLDSLVDRGEDLAMGARGLIDHYLSAEEAASRMQAITREAITRARSLPRGRRHALIVAAMTSFYLCDLRRSSSRLANEVVLSIMQELGGLIAPNMAVLRLRRSLHRGRTTQAVPFLSAGGPVEGMSSG
jgi:tetraprenyl-beta-curcumene synthase